MTWCVLVCVCHLAVKLTSWRQAFRLFQREERLPPGSEWHCPRCQEPRESTKQLSLWRLPPCGACLGV